MAAPYIPPKLADYALWAANFATKLDADPALYGVSAADAAAVVVANDDFQAAFLLSTTISTRTKDTINATNALRASSVALFRALAAQISINPGVDSADKIALGLNLPNHTPSPIPAPSTNPILTLVGGTPLGLTLRYADFNTPDARKKPQGVMALQLFQSVGVAVATDPEAALLVATPTKQPVGLDYSAPQAGKIATIWGRWVTRTGLVGPWSASINAIIMGA